MQRVGSIRVLVANSNAIESQLLAKAIARQRLSVLGFAVHSAEIRQSISHLKPDVLLLTPGLDGEQNGGLDVLAECRTSSPELKIVMLLESADPDIVVQSFRLGARGVFSKNSSLKVLRKCIECVQAGQVWATTEQLGFVLSALATARAIRPADSVNLQKLSTRELEVVNSLAEGLSNEEIARRLSLSRHTVKNHIARIFHKLGASSRLELLFNALRCPPDAGVRPPKEVLSGNGTRSSPGGPSMAFPGNWPKAA